MKRALSPLLTDLYQLTMMQAYFDKGMAAEASFEFFFRKFPPERQFLVACGLEQAVEYLENLRFSEEDLDFLARDGRFHSDFLDHLRTFSFTGSLYGMAEGTVFFPDEPVLRVTAPLPQAQLVETRLINIMQFQTMIASKAVRMTRIMPDKLLVDYGLRRSHGSEAGIMAARASYVAGFSGTATVLAGKLFDIPIYGTMAHSFIQAHDSEEEAFWNFATSHPQNCVLLLDTYDTERATNRVIELAEKLRDKNITIRGVRLDSGDMIALSKKVRTLLDHAGLQEVRIIASGDLDEYKLQAFRDPDAPVDGFGIGSRLTTSADVPYFNCAYKLVEYNGLGRRKLAEKKVPWPGRKQVFRQFRGDSHMHRDILGLEGEQQAGVPLIHRYMQDGKRAAELPGLSATRKYLLSQLGQLPADIDIPGHGYPVIPSQRLQDYADEVSKRMAAREG